MDGWDASVRQTDRQVGRQEHNEDVRLCVMGPSIPTT